LLLVQSTTKFDDFFDIFVKIWFSFFDWNWYQWTERCSSQRHFLGYMEERGDNHKNMHFLRQLMGFCMFHTCKETALLAESDLASFGVEEVGGGVRFV
jgi:hypothetical protein